MKFLELNKWKHNIETPIRDILLLKRQTKVPVICAKFRTDWNTQSLCLKIQFFVRRFVFWEHNKIELVVCQTNLATCCLQNLWFQWSQLGSRPLEWIGRLLSSGWESLVSFSFATLIPSFRSHSNIAVDFCREAHLRFCINRISCLFRSQGHTLSEFFHDLLVQILVYPKVPSRHISFLLYLSSALENWIDGWPPIDEFQAFVRLLKLCSWNSESSNGFQSQEK